MGSITMISRPSFRAVELTPEEQEELRKKEERKDKLHQAYLKSKASGVFVHVGDLPPQEPQKGKLPAKIAS